MPLGGGPMEMSPDQLLESKVLFTLPDGDAGIARKREIQEFVADSGYGATFLENDTTTFTLASNGMMIDPSQCYLSFTLTVDPVEVTDQGAHPILEEGAKALINQITITSFGGQVMEELPDYNIYGAVVDRYTLSPEWFRKHGHDEAWPPHKWTDPGANRNFAWDGTNSTTHNLGDYQTILNAAGAHLTAASAHGLSANVPAASYNPGKCGAMYRYCSSLVNGRKITLPLRHSGLFGSSKYIPLNVLGNIRLAIKWELARKAFRCVILKRLPNDPPLIGSTDLAAASPSTQVYVDEVMKHFPYEGDQWQQYDSSKAPSATTFDTLVSVPTYTITKVKLICAMVQASAAMQQAIDAAVNGEGLPMHFSTYARSRTALAGGAQPASGSVTAILPKNVSNASSLFALFHTDLQDTSMPTNPHQSGSLYVGGQTSSMLAGQFDFRQSGVRDWQFRIGTEFYPRFVVRDASIGHRISMEAIPRLKWADQEPAIDLQRYSWQDNYTLVSARQDASDPKNESSVGYQMSYFPGVHIDDEVYPNSFVMGVNLQSTPGLELSGISTVSGAQPMLELQIDSTKSEKELANERYYNKKSLLLFMQYTRVLLLSAGQNVVVKE